MPALNAQNANPVQDQNVVVQPGPGGQLNLKIEQNKLPVFYGMKNKDTVTAAHMISRIQSLIATNGWTDEQAYSNFALALQGPAQEWFRSNIILDDTLEKKWSYIEEDFRQTFATQEDDSALLDQLANFSMKQSDDVLTYHNRVHRIIELVHNNCPDGPDMPPAAAANGVYTPEEIAAYKKTLKSSFTRYLAIQVFRAGLTRDLRAVVTQANPENYKQAFKIAKNQDMIKKSTGKPIALLDDAQEIDAVQPNFRPQRPQFQPRQNNGNNWNRSNNSGRQQPQQQQRQQQQQPQRYNNRGPGNNSNRNSNMVCTFCRITGHHQDDCRKRIAANKPCITTNGKIYWPKAVQAVESNGNEEVSMLDFQFQP